jgi:hypothetical protein
MPSGAWNTAASPAAMLASMITRRSPPRRPALRPSSAPSPTEIWAAGPSLPATPPEPMIRAEEIALTSGTRARTWPPCWW